MRADLTVTHPDLVDHAGRVAAIGDRVDAAASAGRAVRAAPAAYGKMCAMVPKVLDALQDVLTAGIASEAVTLDDGATKLRTTADDYAAADDRRATAFGAIGGS